MVYNNKSIVKAGRLLYYTLFLFASLVGISFLIGCPNNDKPSPNLTENGSNPGSYTIHYDANGGKNPPKDQTKEKGKTITLDAGTTVTAPNGRQFASWNTKPDGSGTRYSAALDYTADQELTLYAQWSYPPDVMPQYPSVSGFSTNTGPGLFDNPMVIEFRDGNITDPITIKCNFGTHRTFYNKIYLKKNSSNIIVNTPLTLNTLKIVTHQGLSVFVLCDYNRDGVFEKKFYSKTNTNSNTNTVEFPPTKFEEGLTVLRIFLTEEPISETEFLQTIKNNNQANKKILIYDIKLYQQISIVYLPNTGQNAPGAQRKEKGKDITLDTGQRMTPPKGGKQFAGWNTEFDGSGDAYTAGQIYTEDKYLKLYAQWQSP